MQIRFSKDLIKELGKISKKDKELATRIEKKLSLFKENPKHPSLRLHKLTGELQDLWSVSITRSIRMVYIQRDDEAYFTDIGTHDEVYRR